MGEEKTIHDPVHGSMKMGGIILALTDTAEVQRLRGIKQLGLANIAFPGANHSRFEHALGTAHLAESVGKALGLKASEREMVMVAALLHDIGHAPFSHTLEYLIVDFLKKDHMEITGEIIEGELSVSPEEELEKIGVPTVNEIMEKRGIPTEEVSQLLLGKHRKKYLGELLHSEVDVDQMDYLLRDSHFTGVALGMVDAHRLTSILRIKEGKLCILSKGVEAVEGLLTARGLMYSSVYFHHTVRAAEMMLANAVDRALRDGKLDPDTFFLMNDSQLIMSLERCGGYPAEIVQRLKYRRLFKPALTEPRRELTREKKREYLKKFGRWKRVQEVQEKIASAAGVEAGRVILDVPVVDIIISEPRLEKVEMPVIADGKILSLSKVSPLASALKKRQAPRYFLRVLTEEKYLPEVRRAARKVLL
ncbi:MAG: HD domain-containing protein [Candidatus Hadarchaeales archaeon]